MEDLETKRDSFVRYRIGALHSGRISSASTSIATSRATATPPDSFSSSVVRPKSFRLIEPVAWMAMRSLPMGRR